MKKKIVAILLIGFCCSGAGIGLARMGVLDRMEAATWAWRVKAFAKPGPATDKIRIILLDQASLDWGLTQNAWPWPWPREVYGAILDFCRRGGAKAIAFDVLFTEPSYLGVADDEALGAAIARTPEFIGSVFLSPTPAAKPDPGILSRIGRSGSLVKGIPNQLGPDTKFESVITPVSEMLNAASWFGNVSGLPDEDGIFRRMAPLGYLGGAVLPTLGLSVFLATHPPGSLLPTAVRVPVDGQGYSILRYRGPPGTHRTVSAAAVIQSEIRWKTGEGVPVLDPELFRDTYVFFGFSAPGLLDLRPTPLSRVCPGVELHATFLDNLLSGDFLQKPEERIAGAVSVLVTLLVCGFLLSIRKVWTNSLVAGGSLLFPVLLGFAAYPAGWWWPVASLWVSVLLAVGCSLLYNYSTEGRQKAFIKTAFRHYLSPVVIDRILKDPSQLKLGGERRELSIFFSDLQGFSSLSEKLDPTRLTTLLNDYLSDMTEIILDEGGTLDKYEGDAILAFWNAPLEQSDHAVRAVRAGLRCQAKLAGRRAEFEQRSGVLLRMRIGIHTGDVVVGNMGSRDRFDYTVLGDAANLASRLEGANKAFGTYFMVSEATWSATCGQFVGRELCQLRVVGRTTPVRVFEPFGNAQTPVPPYLPAFAKSLALYRRGERVAAIVAFTEIAGVDPAAQAYARRCQEELSGEVLKSEDGVWTLNVK